MLALSGRPYSRCTSNLYSSCSYHSKNDMKLDEEMKLITKGTFPKPGANWNKKLLPVEDLEKASRKKRSDNLLELLRLFTEADEDKPQALYDIARCYFEGKGLQEDYELGVNYLKDAAESKHPAAINDWGRFMMLLGLDSRAFGVALIVLAANKKCPDAEMNLGLFYETGIGMRQDLEKSLQHYKNALALGSLHAAKAISRIEKKIDSRE